MLLSLSPDQHQCFPVKTLVMQTINFTSRTYHFSPQKWYTVQPIVKENQNPVIQTLHKGPHVGSLEDMYDWYQKGNHF